MKPVDSREFLKCIEGTWKRTLEWRHFGGNFEHLKTSNRVVKIVVGWGGEGAGSIDWHFGESEEDLRREYTMRVLPTSDRDLHLEWQMPTGEVCDGTYHGDSGALVLSFALGETTASVTYRVADKDELAVCAVDVNGAGITPSVQLGTMLRVGTERSAQ